jgi:hypothetical protein
MVILCSRCYSCFLFNRKIPHMNKKKCLILLFLLIAVKSFLPFKSWAQSNSRMENLQYTQLKLLEDFDSQNLDTGVWRVVSELKKDNLYIFVDNENTVIQSDGNLALSMYSHPGFTSKTWTPDGDSTITADYIAAEVITHEAFSYGIFECSATFAYDRGSFPAFWLYSDAMCFETDRPEIDIVELKADRRNPTLDNNIWYYPLNCLPHTSHEFDRHPFEWGGTHNFKAVWTPAKIEFWVDNILLKVVENTGQYWYPQLPQHVVLSQQIVRFGRLFSRSESIVTPQTSFFHTVRVREFFLAPEITCPDVIMESVPAILDVDTAATDITWELAPEALFSGRTTGTGTKAMITPAGNSAGIGKIYFRFKMPSGEFFYAAKDIEVKRSEN